jgi:glycyl-tRNA synthetase beta chain
VIVHFSERCAIIRDGANAAAEAAGLTLVEDAGLVTENAGLTEWPVPMLGRFDPAFLEVPEEVIQLTARVNQKYFVCQDANGKLANAFVCTANIVANDGGAAIVAGNEKVLAARLSDAKFFWEQDLKVPLIKRFDKLGDIVFHERLGTVRDKAHRLAMFAEWFVDSGVVSGTTVENVEHAALLAKVDLVTGMVGEFPELQGIMGGYYAFAQGENEAVSIAVRDHYKPLGQGDAVPTEPTTIAVSLADKFDSLYCFFSRDLKPTGSKDPFALRRAAIGFLEILNRNELSLSITKLVDAATRFRATQLLSKAADRDKKVVELSEGVMDSKDGTAYIERLIERVEKLNLEDGLKVKLDYDEQAFQWTYEALVIVHRKKRYTNEILDFLADRLKVQQREAGVRHDLIDAVFALGGEDDLVRLLARVKALQAFVATDEGVNLLAGYKRAANILKQSGDDKNSGHPELISGSYSSDAEESKMLKQVQHDGLGEVEGNLLTALDTAEPKAAAAVEAEDFEGAMAALASLRAPIDAFFEGVMVNDPDPQKRAFRLGLLARFRDAVHRVADFSRIEG